MPAPPVRTERHGAVLEVVLDRPPVNAIDQSLADALYEAFTGFRDDDELAVAVLIGGGHRAFSAGWDLKAAAVDGDDVGMTPGGWGGITELWDLHKPVIAAVDGPAVAGGFELVLACDLVVAADHVQFWLTEVSLGILPSSGGLQWLPRRLGASLAADLILTGRRLSAQEARAHGLVRDVVPLADLRGHALALAAEIAGAPTETVQLAKAILRNTAHLPIDVAFRSGEG
jgi:crotonobetainyl-CoA hydratase